MRNQKLSKENPTESALDRRLTVTKFRDARAFRKKEICVSLRELAGKMPRRVAESKDALPLLKLGRLGNKRSRFNSLRHNANMVAIDGVEGDYDGEELSIEDAAAMMREADIAAVFCTSPSHTPEAPRWRIFCPTSCELAPSERERLIARVNGVLGGALASESFILSQSYYYGSVEGQPTSQVELVEGRPIDLADELDAIALDKNGLLFNREEPEAANDDDDDFRRPPDVERIRKALDDIPADVLDNDYWSWFKMGAALHHEFGGDPEGMELWREASERCLTYDLADLEATWASFGSYGGKSIKIGTLYRLAEKHRAKAKRFGELRFLTTEECTTAPSRGYIVKGLIAPGDVACIFGAPGAGKSLIAPHIGYQVALGDTAFGMRTRPGGVLYVAAEDPHGMKSRITALAIRQGHASLFRIVEGVSDLFADESPDLDALTEAVEEERPALIIIDTLAMAFPGLEENDAASMARVVAVARQLAEHGAAVVLIHHDTKAEGSTPRGHSVFNGALDMALHVKRDDEGIVRGRLTKNRNGSADRDIAFRIGTEELGEDEDGDAITAAHVSELTGSAAARPVHMSTAQREALATLAELDAQGDVSETAWRDACIDGRRVSQSEERDSRKRTFNNARKALFEKGLIAFHEGNVALAAIGVEDDDE